MTAESKNQTARGELPVAPSLIEELAASPGRFALIAAPEREGVLLACEDHLASTRCRVGSVVTRSCLPPDAADIESQLDGHRLLVDIEVLFAPQINVDPALMLRRLARRTGCLVAQWPGVLAAGKATFSAPGRPDFYSRHIDDVLVLRPVEQSFPDEPAFEIERWMT